MFSKRNEKLLAIIGIIVVAVMLIVIVMNPVGGRVWNEIIQITHADDLGYSPVYIEYAGQKYFFYIDRGKATPDRIAYMTGDFGAFSSPSIILNNSSYRPTKLWTAISNDKLFLLWLDTQRELALRYMIFDGTSWSAPRNLTLGEHFSVSNIDGKIYVLYKGADGKLYMLIYNGRWFKENINANGDYPVIAKSDMVYYIFWVNSTGIYASSYSDGSLGIPIKILSLKRVVGYDVFSYGDYFYLTWNDYLGDGNYEIFATKFILSGGEKLTSWSDRVSYGDGLSTNSHIVVYHSKIIVVWEDDRYGKTAIMLRIKNEGIWSDEYRVSPEDITSKQPDLYIVSDKLYLFWEEYTLPSNVWGTVLII